MGANGLNTLWAMALGYGRDAQDAQDAHNAQDAQDAQDAQE